MRAWKIVFVGAGSSDFGPRVIADVVTNPAMKGSTLSLVDVDAAGLELIDRLARRMNEEWGGGLTIESSVDRREALLLDPMITDIEQARGILDGYLKAHG